MKRHLRGFFTTTVMAAGLLTSGTAMAATDMFLKMDNIKGESVDDRHKGEIDVLAWSWGESAGTARTRHGLVPPACIQDLNVTKFIDSASPALIMDAVLGQIVQTAVLTLRRGSGKDAQDYLRLTMRNVSVAAYQTGGSGAEDRLMEQVVLHFESMDGEYSQQRADGSLGAPITWQVGGASTRGCQ